MDANTIGIAVCVVDALVAVALYLWALRVYEQGDAP